MDFALNLQVPQGTEEQFMEQFLGALAESRGERLLRKILRNSNQVKSVLFGYLKIFENI